MKTFVLFLIAFVSFKTIKAQEFKTLLDLFDTASLPYVIPQGAFVDPGNEEFESAFSGKSISNELAIKYLNALEDNNTTYEANCKFEFGNYIGLVFFKTSIKNSLFVFIPSICIF